LTNKWTSAADLGYIHGQELT